MRDNRGKQKRHKKTQGEHNVNELYTAALIALFFYAGLILGALLGYNLGYNKALSRAQEVMEEVLDKVLGEQVEENG